MNIEKIKQIQDLHKKGTPYNEISKQLDISKHQARYYDLFFSVDDFLKKEKEKSQEELNICELVKNSNNINQVCKKLSQKGTNTQYLKIQHIIDKYNLDTSHFCNITNNEKNKPLSLDNILCENINYPSSRLLKRIIKEKLKEHKCERCGRTEWEGEKIPLELHHINGNHNDNRIENLQLLCPNCHSITDNFCGKNKPKKQLPNKRKLKSYICKFCGKEFKSYYPNNFCCDEHHDEYIKQNKIYTPLTTKCPSKKDLINDFKTLTTFTKIGEKYGVSDKTIVKWCKKLDLPSNKKDIIQYVKNFNI